jgi:hypothetical protein
MVVQALFPWGPLSESRLRMSGQQSMSRYDHDNRSIFPFSFGTSLFCVYTSPSVFSSFSTFSISFNHFHFSLVCHSPKEQNSEEFGGTNEDRQSKTDQRTSGHHSEQAEEIKEKATGI